MEAVINIIDNCQSYNRLNNNWQSISVVENGIRLLKGILVYIYMYIYNYVHNYIYIYMYLIYIYHI